jgi:large subunit ribosomal protein L22
VADMIRYKPALQARNILNFTPNRSARPLMTLLNSAVANAKNNFKLEVGNLFLEKIEVNDGRKLKRSRPRAKGSAYPIQKKTSHVILVLTDEIKAKKPEIKKSEVKKPETKKVEKTVKPKVTKKHES